VLGGLVDTKGDRWKQGKAGERDGKQLDRDGVKDIFQTGPDWGNSGKEMKGGTRGLADAFHTTLVSRRESKKNSRYENGGFWGGGE